MNTLVATDNNNYYSAVDNRQMVEKIHKRSPLSARRWETQPDDKPVATPKHITGEREGLQGCSSASFYSNKPFQTHYVRHNGTSRFNFSHLTPLLATYSLLRLTKADMKYSTVRTTSARGLPYHRSTPCISQHMETKLLCLVPPSYTVALCRRVALNSQIPSLGNRSAWRSLQNTWGRVFEKNSPQHEILHHCSRSLQTLYLTSLL